MTEKRRADSPLRKKRERIVFWRYFLPILVTFCLTLLYLLPTTAFREKGGDSERGSIFFWAYQMLYDEEGGIVDYLKGDSEVTVTPELNRYALKTMWTVGILFVLYFLGMLLTLLSSFSALYLLSLEPEDGKRKKGQKLYQLFFWNRGVLIAGYLLLLLPALFPHLLAGYTTDYGIVTAVAPGFDPLYLGVPLLGSALFLTIYSGQSERMTGKDLFVRHSARLLQEETEDAEWHEAVENDCSGEGEHPYIHGFNDEYEDQTAKAEEESEK